MLKLQGLTHQKIATMTGFTKSWVDQIVVSPAGKAYMQTLMAKKEHIWLNDPAELVRSRLAELALPAVNKLAKLMDSSDSERIGLNSANSILDRTVPRKIVQAPASPQIVISDKLMDKLIKVLDEGKRAYEAIDAEVVKLEPEPEDP